MSFEKNNDGMVLSPEMAMSNFKGWVATIYCNTCMGMVNRLNEKVIGDPCNAYVTSDVNDNPGIMSGTFEHIQFLASIKVGMQCYEAGWTVIVDIAGSCGAVDISRYSDDIKFKIITEDDNDKEISLIEIKCDDHHLYKKLKKYIETISLVDDDVDDKIYNISRLSK